MVEEKPGDKLICTRHDAIIEFADQIKKLVGLPENDKHIRKLCNAIAHEARLAMQSGKDMEDRLTEYRDAIEDLGFRRVKDKPVDS